MQEEIVNPNVQNLIDSLRDIGYSFEVAVADLIDNSITANSKNIRIQALARPNLTFSILDDGEGMSENELKEAMRLASRNPNEKRDKNDLGRFGLGLKTASFSQCKKLTVISKVNEVISVKQWDLNYIAAKNAWYLITPNSLEQFPQYNELIKQKKGTLVIWENIDRVEAESLSELIDKLRRHLSLVFHRFLEGIEVKKTLKISVNNNELKPFNPFNSNHPATQQGAIEKLKLHGQSISIQPFILPHHSKLSQQEYELYATEEGYIKSQGFYLYRENRVLIYGTWWGMHKVLDAHKLVRIKIDISNSMDTEWGIDIKKSIARPSELIKMDLRRIIGQVTERGSRPYTGRGRKIEDKSIIQFWEVLPYNDLFYFALNQEHPLFKDVKNHLTEDQIGKLKIYLKGVEAYLPIEAIQYRLQKNPHSLKQNSALSEEDIEHLKQKINNSGLPQEYIDELLKSEIFVNNKDIHTNGNK